MSKIRETIISNCEKNFVHKCLNENRRLDGRAFNEFRELHIEYTKDWGCCYVSLGKTRVLAQVSCEIQQPKASKPNEGILIINVELTPMGAPHFEPGRQSDLSVHLNRILEKALKDSKAIDLESLCIKVNEKVWCLRVDVNILNHEGNLVDCASVAALSALAHFRRPDISSDGEEFTVHTYAQKDPIPTVIHHYPVCVSYAIFNEGAVVLADPNLLEEDIADASLVMVLNGFKELCGLDLGGKALLAPETVLNCTSKAAARALIVIEQIKEVLEIDKDDRILDKVINFESGTQFDNTISKESLSVHLNIWDTKRKKNKRANKNKKESIMETDEIVSTQSGGKIEALSRGSAVLLPTEESYEDGWTTSSTVSESSDIEEITTKEQPKINVPVTSKNYEEDQNSEEEDVVVINPINPNHLNKKKRIK